ncbi:hypothetical protein ABZW49_44525 [Nonomuraea wenchangensis]
MPRRGLVAATADKDPVVALSAVAQIRAEMERTEAVLVRRARNKGATWVEIAAALVSPAGPLGGESGLQAGLDRPAVHRPAGPRPG